MKPSASLALWRIGMIVGCAILGFAIYAWSGAGFRLEAKHDSSMVGRGYLYLTGLGLFIFLYSLFRHALTNKMGLEQAVHAILFRLQLQGAEDARSAKVRRVV